MYIHMNQVIDTFLFEILGQCPAAMHGVGSYTSALKRLIYQ